MSEESTAPDLIELGNRFLEAANRRDLDAMMSFFAPAAVLKGMALRTTFEGVAAIRGFWQDWFTSYEELWFEQEEALDLGNGVRFSVVILKGRLVGSSREVRQRSGVVGKWVDGLIVGVMFHLDIDEARVAAERLAEEGAQADMPEKSTTPDLARLVQQRVDAVNARDIDAAMGFYDSDAVYDTSPIGLGRFEGRVAIRGFFEEWWGTYEQSEFALEEMRDLGEGVAFCVLVMRGRLPGAPGWVELRYASAEQWRGSLVECITNYPDPDEARAAAERLVAERG